MFVVEIGWGESCAICQKKIGDDAGAVHIADRRRVRAESSYMDFHGDCWQKALRKIEKAQRQASASTGTGEKGGR